MLEENDNLKPEDAAAAARKLIETDKVVAMVGGFSIIDCPVNADYYKQQGYYVIVAGVPAECFSSPNIAAVNMGPGYSALGAAQIVVEKGAKGTMVTMTNKTATSDYNNSLAGLYAQSKGLKWIDIQIPPPIEDADGAVQDAVAKAGEGGAIVLNYTPPEGLKILKAAEEAGPDRQGHLGLVDTVERQLRRRCTRSGVGQQAQRQRRAQPARRSSSGDGAVPHGLGEVQPATHRWAASSRWAS